MTSFRALECQTIFIDFTFAQCQSLVRRAILQQACVIAGSTIAALLTSFGMRLHVLTLLRSVRILLFTVAGGGGAGTGAGAPETPLVARTSDGDGARKSAVSE